MLNYINSKLKIFINNIQSALQRKKKPKILITNLSLSDRIYLSDLIYKEDGICVSYKFNEGATTKFSEIVITKNYKFMFYKQQFFMENSLENFLTFSNDSKIKLNDIDGILFMLNYKNYKAIKFALFELESLLELFVDHPAVIKIVVFNGPKNNYLDENEIDKVLRFKELRLRYFKDLRCYFCNFSNGCEDLEVIVKDMFQENENNNGESELENKNSKQILSLK